IVPSKSKGAPIDGINPEPALARNSAMALLKDAPHPYAAMLFVDWVLGDEGQSEIAKAGYNPTRNGVKPKTIQALRAGSRHGQTPHHHTRHGTGLFAMVGADGFQGDGDGAIGDKEARGARGARGVEIRRIGIVHELDGGSVVLGVLAMI
ncbi:MAG: hypothetical protein WCG92_24750, partial [Hyphomicrobiales bacterium]